MKNKEKYLTNFSEAKRKEATQKYNIIKPFILGNQSLSSISKNKDIALSTLYRWNKLYKEEGLTGLIHNTRVDKGDHKLEQNIIDEIKRLSLKNKRNSIATIHRKIVNYCIFNCQIKCNTLSLKSSAGVFQSNRLRGRVFNL